MTVKTVTSQYVYEMCEKHSDHDILDVRTLEECSKGMAQGALHLSLEDISTKARSLLDASKTYFVMCQSGQRSELAIKQLSALGFVDLFNVDKGYSQWLSLGLPINTPETNEVDLRYARHIQLYGKDTQKKLLNTRILVIGAGGLGSPCLLYLAASGIGSITVMDDDVVELSNLHRQVIHDMSFIGKPKVDSALSHLKALNPDIRVKTINGRLTSANIDEIVQTVDVVIDGSDNMKTRYLVNDNCVKWQKPMIYASVYQYEYQVSVFDFTKNQQACLRCLFPENKNDEPENCSTAGVLGTVPGIAGLMQATEAIKLITGIGRCLSNELLIGDVLTQKNRIIKFAIDPNCTLHK